MLFKVNTPNRYIFNLSRSLVFIKSCSYNVCHEFIFNFAHQALLLNYLSSFLFFFKLSLNFSQLIFQFLYLLCLFWVTLLLLFDFGRIKNELWFVRFDIRFWLILLRKSLHYLPWFRYYVQRIRKRATVRSFLMANMLNTNTL